MKQVDRTKTCWSCEADVSFESTYCPFCGTDLLTSFSEPPPSSPPREAEKFTEQSLQESLASLYKPPYSVRNKQGFGIPDEKEEIVFAEAQPPKEDPLFQPYEYEEKNISDELEGSSTEERSDEESQKGTVLPLLLLLVGTHLFLLGMLILFFSSHGRVVLEWNSQYWFLYLLLGGPLLFFGVRLLKKKSVDNLL